MKNNETSPDSNYLSSRQTNKLCFISEEVQRQRRGDESCVKLPDNKNLYEAEKNRKTHEKMRLFLLFARVSAQGRAFVSVSGIANVYAD